MSAEVVERRRVIVLALNFGVSVRILNYVRDLADAGVEVHLVLADQRRADEAEVDPRVRVHVLLPAEGRHPLRRAENLLVYRAPGKAIAVASGLAHRSRVARPLTRPLDLLGRGHRRAARIVHHRGFQPFYKTIRPYLLSRRFRELLKHVDVATADRIVAADISAVTLAWRLARRFPGPVATTGLDRAPYIAPS
jgi:hypothetical protein